MSARFLPHPSLIVIAMIASMNASASATELAQFLRIASDSASRFVVDQGTVSKESGSPSQRLELDPQDELALPDGTARQLDTADELKSVDEPAASTDEKENGVQKELSADENRERKTDDDEVDARLLVQQEQLGGPDSLANRPLSDLGLAGMRLSELAFEHAIATPNVGDAGTINLKTMTWVNPAPVNQPTYFDDVDLERYGHENQCQTARSATRFAADVLLLPIEVLRHPPCRPVYQSGLQRPGDLACPVAERCGP